MFEHERSKDGVDQNQEAEANVREDECDKFEAETKFSSHFSTIGRCCWCGGGSGGGGVTILEQLSIRLVWPSVIARHGGHPSCFRPLFHIRISHLGH